jgi:hypothetical protein
VGNCQHSDGMLPVIDGVQGTQLLELYLKERAKKGGTDDLHQVVRYSR